MEQMTKSLAKIWARRIHAGTRTKQEVKDRYSEEGYQMVKEAYFLLYGEDFDNIN